MFLPLPDELIERYLGQGEQKIHSDHPSFRAFLITNGLLVLVLLAATAVFVIFAFNGSTLGGVFLGLVAIGVAAALFFRRLSEAYTSYVITTVRIIRLSGVLSRRVKSIPWVRVTDLSMEQKFIGRILGYATVHIESANEESGLKNLKGISDPVRFHSYLVDMVVAKHGAIDKDIETRPGSGGLRQRLRSARERVRERSLSEADWSPGAAPDAEAEQTVVERGTRPLSSTHPYYADRRQVIVHPPLPRSSREQPPPEQEPDEEEGDDLGPRAEEVDEFVAGFRRAGGGVPFPPREDLGDLSDIDLSEPDPDETGTGRGDSR
ncbi:MAG: PH domain-containing protein [Acidimicrobiia bacterium]